MNWLHVENQLAAYLDDQLSAGAAKRVKRHLAGCERCRRSAERMREVRLAIHELPVCAAPDALWARIEHDIALSQSAVRRVDRQTGASIRAGLASPVKRHALWALALTAAAAMLVFAVRWTAYNRLPSWEVKTVAGRPTIGWFAFGSRGRLRVGDQLSTDRASQAEISVADIGTVKIAPGSRVRLSATGSAQHRLELEQGALEARVVAPPRLFVVDTQAGRAVDLGCAYKLKTDGGSSTLLRVTVGQVALEDGGRSALVPMGFTCESRRSAGLGTPLQEDSPEPLRSAVRRFDFERGGDAAAEQARIAARPEDAMTLWHLLRRTSPAEQSRIYDTLAAMVHPPTSATRSGIMAADQKMLDDWRDAILYEVEERAIGSGSDGN